MKFKPFTLTSKKTIVTLIYTISAIVFFSILISHFDIVNVIKDVTANNYIINGNFYSGLKGWKFDNAKIVDNNGIQSAYVKGEINKRNRIQQIVNVISGETYRLSFTLTAPNKGAYAGIRNEKNRKETYFWCNGINTNIIYNWDFTPKNSGNNTIFLSAGREGEYYFSGISLIKISNKISSYLVLSLVAIFIIAILFLTYVFVKKWNCYLFHYLIGLTIVILALSNFNFSLILIAVLTIIFLLTLKLKWFVIFPLVSLVIFAFLKRIILLGEKCFWWDEFLTETRVWFTASQLFKHPMTARCLLYSFILKIYASFISFFNNNNYLTEFQLRLPHAIIGTLALIIIYLIGKRFKDKVTGLLMIFFAAFSSFLIYYAREARFYPFVLFFSACLIHAVVLILYRDFDCKKSKILLYYVYYSLASICGMHTHQGFWLLFAASNIFLGIFELINFILYSKNKKIDFIYLILIFLFLVLPVLTAYSGIYALLGKGADSNIIKAEKLVPRLDISFFKNVHKELWEGIRYGLYMHFCVMAAIIIMLFFKTTRKLSLYLLTVIILTFVSLRNMGTFREPFRVKYITFMWLVEIVAIVFSLVSLLDYSLAKVKNRNLACFIYTFALSLIAVVSLSNPANILKLPNNINVQESFRTIAANLNRMVKSNDIIVTSEEGYTALQYYKRFYFSNWRIIGVDQIESKYNGNFIYDGFAYCFFHKNTIKEVKNNLFEKLSLGYSNFTLYRSKNPLNPLLQNNLLVSLIDGFKDYNKLPIRGNVARLYFNDNYIVNGSFTNGFNGWKMNRKNIDNISMHFTSSNDVHCLNISNNYSKTLVISQSFSIPTGGLYSLTFKTRGFYNGGHLSIRSKDVNEDVYRAEITNCPFTKFHNVKFNKPQKVTINITIKPNGYATLYNLGFYRLEKH